MWYVVNVEPLSSGNLWRSVAIIPICWKDAESSELIQQMVLYHYLNRVVIDIYITDWYQSTFYAILSLVWSLACSSAWQYLSLMLDTTCLMPYVEVNMWSVFSGTKCSTSSVHIFYYAIVSFISSVIFLNTFRPFENTLTVCPVYSLSCNWRIRTYSYTRPSAVLSFSFSEHTRSFLILVFYYFFI